MENKIKAPRYIGSTGYTTREQIKEVLQRSTILPIDQCKLMIGVLISDKTMGGLKTKYPLRYPRVTKIEDIFINDSRCFNTLHYHPDSHNNLPKKMVQAIMFGGNNCHAIQLNTAWPNLEELDKFRRVKPHIRIILEVGVGAQVGCKNDPTLIMAKVAAYKGLVDYVLPDPSEGKGLPLNMGFTHELLTQFTLHDLWGTMGFVIAGGLDNENVSQILQPFIHLPISCDAEGGLRTADDEMILDKVVSYNNAAYKDFRAVMAFTD